MACHLSEVISIPSHSHSPILRPQLSLVIIGLNPVTAEPDLHLHRSSLLCYETEVDQLPHVDDKVTPTLWEF